MEKNVAGKWTVFAYGAPDHATLAGLAITGDAAQITANVRLDGGAANAVDDTNPTELEDGYYIFDITAAENNADLVSIHPASSTADVIVIGVPGAVWPVPANFNALGIEADGDVTKVNLLDAHTAQTGDNYARLGAPAGASVSADVADVVQDIDDVKGTGFIKDVDSLTDIRADTNELQGDDVPGLIAALNDLASADVLTQVNAALDTAISELGVAAPTATPTLRTGLMLLYMALRNKTVVQTSGTDALEIHNNAGTKIASKLLTDDGSDYTEAEMA